MTDTLASTIRVVLVDDSKLVRRGLCAVLSAETDPAIEVVAEAGSVAEAVAVCREAKPDIVILDIRLPDGTGFDASRRISEELPDTRFLVLTSHSNDNYVYEAVTSGVQGYLMKEVDPASLIHALREIAAGRSSLDPDITSRVLRLLRGPSKSESGTDLSILSHQERRVLELVAQGLTNKQVAEQLGLSRNTVKNYLMNVFEKLQIKRRSQAAVLFVQQNQQRDRDAGT